jgi:uncharacterized metal-binding protein
MTLENNPLVYSCSGGSNVAQLANDIAVVMSREGLAQMSCIAGVGGGVEKMVLIATSGRDICAIDGCHLGCVKKTLARYGVKPKWHVQLTSLGLTKREDEACSISEHYQALRYVYRTTGLVDDTTRANVDAF